MAKGKPTQGGGQLPNYTVAHIKLVVLFCAYGFSGLLTYSVYSVVLKREGAFFKTLQDYFECESTGVSPNKTCERSVFENLDPTEFTFPTAIMSYLLYPFATLLYVINIKKLIKWSWRMQPKSSSTHNTHS